MRIRAIIDSAARGLSARRFKEKEEKERIRRNTDQAAFMWWRHSNTTLQANFIFDIAPCRPEGLNIPAQIKTIMGEERRVTYENNITHIYFSSGL